MQVDLKRTPLEFPGGILPLLDKALVAAIGKPSGVAAPYLLAIMALENRRGKAIWNYNWGNSITGSDTAADYWMVKDNPRHFRANTNHIEGAARWVKVLLNRHNKRILDAAYADDFSKFFSSIHTKSKYGGAYDTGSVNRGPAYRSLVKEFKREGYGTTKQITPKSSISISSGGAGVILIIFSAILVGGALWAKKSGKYKRFY